MDTTDITDTAGTADTTYFEDTANTTNKFCYVQTAHIIFSIIFQFELYCNYQRNYGVFC